MRIKQRDHRDKDIQELSFLLDTRLSAKQRFLINREIKSIRSGEKGEKDSGYFIDYYYMPSERWVVLHDLRLVHNSISAQIDHLLINLVMDFYVLETKNFGFHVRINEEGEFLASDGKEEYAVESPIEQNKRHIHLLEKVIQDHDIMPKRFGLPLTPHFKSLVLVSPTSKVIRPSSQKFDTSQVIKADTLETRIMEDGVKAANDLSRYLQMTQLSSLDAITSIAVKLKALHKPFSIDYRKRFGIRPSTEPLESTSTKAIKKDSPDKSNWCFKCQKPITKEIAIFCFLQKQKFNGRAYCPECQKGFK